jgi:hypothetical protein
MPPFVGPNDLHITYVLTAIADGGTPLAGISTDIDGDVRPHTGHSRPDIGADEFDHPPVSVGKEGDGIPGSFSLEQNYPNPFNPSTTICYALPHNSFVTLTVYNTLGQQVAKLVNEQQEAGYHEAVFRSDGLPSGVYFYRLEAGSFTSTKKLLLLR